MKVAILAAIVALAISFSVAAYKFSLALDDGVALDDSRSEVERQRERSSRALMIIKKDWTDRPVGDVLALSKNLHQDGAIVKYSEKCIEIEDLIFDIERGRVVNVRYFD